MRIRPGRSVNRAGASGREAPTEKGYIPIYSITATLIGVNMLAACENISGESAL